MTPRAAVNVDRARALNDPHPDHVCPGCGANITGWRGHLGHAPGRPGVPTVWHDHQDAAGTCPWVDDMLAARVFRRHLIAGARS